MADGRFEVYQDGAGGWRWRLLAGNGEPIASGESYTSDSDAVRAVETVKENAARARTYKLKKRVGPRMDPRAETRAAERATG